MRVKFVEETANVGRFKAAIAAIRDRFVAEHAICVVAGDAGFGKSRTALWWSLHNRGVMISVAPDSTSGRVIRDLVRELGEPPRRVADGAELQAIGALLADPRPIVVDEVEHALDRGVVALDALRRVADMAEVPLVLVGREGTADKLRRHRQIWRRIGAVADFRPIGEDDVVLLASALAEIDIAADVIAAIHAACEGRVCTAIADIARAEKAGRKAGRCTLADIDVNLLGHPWARRDATIVGLATAKARRRPAAVAAGGRAAS